MRRTHLVAWAMIGLIILTGAEAVSYAALTMVPHLRALTYRAPAVDAAEYEAYLADRDPVLGWPDRHWLEAYADGRGARTSPANAALGDAPPCVALYGDSFTYADEVEDGEAWGDVMAGRLGCPVLNFGVAGYGSDQAVMRLERHLDEAREIGDVVVLGVYPDDLNRNLNQWRYLLQGEPALSFKPAFVAAGDGLRPVPLFGCEHAAFAALAADPGAHLPAESYLPGAEGLKRPVRLGFPYSWSMLRTSLRLVRSIRGFDTGGRQNLVNYPDYYDSPAGPSPEKRELQRRIATRYAELCRRHGKRCIYLFIPEAEQIYQLERTGSHDLEWLLRAAPDGLEPLDGSTIFSGLDDVCASLTMPAACQGHYSANGYRRLADFVLTHLDSTGTASWK